MACEIVHGPITKATVVTGRQIIAGSATKIFNAAASPKAIAGGVPIPVVVVAENDTEDQGGRYKITAGPAIPMINVTEARIQGGPALPVYPVDANGAYDSSFAGTYADKVLATQPGNLIRYWPLWDDVGPAAEELVVGDNGTHVGVTLGQPGIGDGRTCPLYDGINDYTDIWSAAFRAAFNGAEGTVLLWAMVFNVGVWTDATFRYAVNLAADGNNYVLLRRSNANNFLQGIYRAGGVIEIMNMPGLNDVDWMPLVLTWSATADEVRVYKDGSQVGLTANVLGVWAGLLAAATTVIGRELAGFAYWYGWIAHVAIWTTPLSDAEISYLSTV